MIAGRVDVRGNGESLPVVLRGGLVVPRVAAGRLMVVAVWRSLPVMLRGGLVVTRVAADGIVVVAVRCVACSLASRVVISVGGVPVCTACLRDGSSFLLRSTFLCLLVMRVRAVCVGAVGMALVHRAVIIVMLMPFVFPVLMVLESGDISRGGGLRRSDRRCHRGGAVLVGGSGHGGGSGGYLG
jgi:hypothetical protein